MAEIDKVSKCHIICRIGFSSRNSTKIVNNSDWAVGLCQQSNLNSWNRRTFVFLVFFEYEFCASDIDLNNVRRTKIKRTVFFASVKKKKKNKNNNKKLKCFSLLMHLYFALHSCFHRSLTHLLNATRVSVLHYIVWRDNVITSIAAC